MVAKSLDQLLIELRRFRITRLRQAHRCPDTAPVIARLLAPCRTVAIEERTSGLAIRLQGISESGDAFSITCVLHHARASLGLTTAEHEVAGHLCEGRTLAQIALLRGVSANTVKSQVRQVFRKLNVYSRVALVRRLCP